MELGLRSRRLVAERDEETSVRPESTPGWITPRRATLIALTGYVAYAMFVTWPLPTDPSGLLSGLGISGDLGGSVSAVAYVVQHHIFPFAPATFHGLNAPEGLSQQWVLNLADFPGSVLLFGLGYAVGPVAGSAVFLWLGFVLTGWAMFLLARRLFGDPAAAFLAGFVLAFFPFAVDKINGHYQYTQGWVLVLMVWRMLELIDRRTVRNALMAGCAAAFAMWFTPYFILIAGVGFATLAVVLLIVGAALREIGNAVKCVFLAGCPIVLLFGAIGVLTVLAGSGATGEVRTQSLLELYTYSARWLEWLIPDRNNLIFGGATGPYLTSHLHGSNFSESSLYLGVSVILLAFVGSALAARWIHVRGLIAARDIRIIAPLAGLALAVVAAVFSAPPKVHLLEVWIPTPSFFIFHITSTWRVYSRFVELIELGLCLPLACGVTWLLARRDGKWRVLVFSVLAAVLVLDLWARPPVRTVPITAPAAYTWLRDHPGGIVVDYPIEPAVYPDYAPLFWQMIDHHPLFQGYDEDSEDESMKLDMGDLREDTTAPYLADLGVRYIVVHPGQPGADLTNLRRQGYIQRFAAPDGSIWQVGAAPAATRVDGLDGFSLVEGAPNDEYRWMTGPGVLRVYARNCPVCAGVVTFKSSSAVLWRWLTVRQAETGAVLARVHIPPGYTVPVRVPNVLLHHGEAQLLLTTDRPAFPPPHDPRSLSVTVGEPRLSLTFR